MAKSASKSPLSDDDGALCVRGKKGKSAPQHQPISSSNMKEAAGGRKQANFQIQELGIVMDGE